jgi:GR25 family glycosyltransferase involved in LPS biosynthesis
MRPPVSIEETFPARFCLNLDRRPDRRLRAWDQFRRAQLDVERLAAPDAVEMRIIESRGYEKPGPRACAAAHRLAWRSAERRGAEAVLILEDDVVLVDSFRKKLEACLLNLPANWQLFYLGGVFRDPPELIAPGLVRVWGRTWDMHAYAVRKEAFATLHRLVAPLSWRRSRITTAVACTPQLCERDVPDVVPTPMAIDTVIPSIHSRFPTYAAWPLLAWQSEGLSNNENARRGNYTPDGLQVLCTEAVAHLP